MEHPLPEDGGPAGASPLRPERGDTRLLVSMLAACAVVFTVVAVDVTHGGPLSRADPHVAHWCFRHVPGWLHLACRWATHLGDARLLVVFIVFAFAWLFTKQRRFDAVLLASAAGTAALLTAGLKEAFRRSRPVYVDPVHGPRSFSFPSGHSSGAFAVYLLLALLLAVGLSGRARARLIASAVGLAMVVSTTRVLLPVHYLTDVIAGVSIGLAAVVAAMLARTAFVRRR